MNSAKVQSVIEKTFVSAVDMLTKHESGNLISDLYIQVNPEKGELDVYDDEENLLKKVVVFDWINLPDDNFDKIVAEVIKAALSSDNITELFNHDRFSKPLSVSLTDDDFVVIEELLFVDDDTFRLDDPLLKDLDAELDEFLDNLLSDMPE